MYDEVPTVILVSKGRYYKYHKDEYDEESLMDFAIDNHHLAERQGKIPLVPTMWDELVHFWNDEVELKGGAINVMLMMDENRQIWWSAILLVYGLPIATVYIFVLIMRSGFSTEEDISVKTEAIELKNQHTKKVMAAWVEKHPAMVRRRRKWE